MSTLTRRSAYRSYAYLEPGRDYRAFELAPELGRVPAYKLPLDREQAERARRLVAESVVISLHDHPSVYPQRIEQVHEYNRAGR